MNWDQVEGRWKQYKGKLQEKWGKLTDDDLHVINGRRQMLVGKIEEHYGMSKEIAERQVEEFLKALSESVKKEEKARRAGHN
jgi:uncharacterized protein YjbJ (UPF0337 family)